MEPYIPESYLRKEEREGFLVPEMMKRCWATQIKLLCMIGEVCARHGIRWYADYGTLLGAARHRGFIPWDDDIDISMLREDYDRALPLLERELPEECMVLIFGKNQITVSWCAVNNRQHIDFGDSEREAAVTASYFGCPYRDNIDIFPLDHVPADPAERDIFLELHHTIFRIIRNYKAINEAGLTPVYAKQIEELTGQHLELNSDFLPSLCRLEVDLARMYPREEGIGLNNIDNMADHSRGSWREYSWYEGETVYLPFEMIEVPAPPGYTELLRLIFGANWMTPVKGTATHNYPFYREQQETIERYRREKGGVYPR